MFGDLLASELACLGPNDAMLGQEEAYLEQKDPYLEQEGLFPRLGRSRASSTRTGQ